MAQKDCAYCKGTGKVHVPDCILCEDTGITAYTTNGPVECTHCKKEITADRSEGK